MMNLSNDTVRAWLALFVAASFVLICAGLIFLTINPNQQLLTTLLGALSAAGFVQVMTFYFGSSSGSKEKTDALVAQLPEKPKE